jgi:cell division FtsZ-interacting protein ZapD
MNNLARAEQIAFHTDLNRYMRQQDEAERVRQAAEDLYQQSLNDEPLFRTLDDDWEIIEREAVQRMIRNLDAAIKEISRGGLVDCPHLDAITTELNQMQTNLYAACKAEAGDKHD